MSKANGNMNGHAHESLRQRTRALTPNATGASLSRIIGACAVVFFSLIALLYLDDAFPSTESRASTMSAQLNSGIDLDDPAEGSKDVSVSRPQLVDSSPEPDSATIDPATGQLPQRKALVISSYKDQDVSWLEELNSISQG